MNNYSLTNELKKYINEVRETSITDEQGKMYKDAVLFLGTLELDESTKENLKCILFSVIDLKITLGYFL